MTTTDPAMHTEPQANGGQHAEPADAGAETFLDHAAGEYNLLFERAPRMPMDVQIAATLGLGYEVRRLADAIERLEKLLADPTAVLRAAQAEAEAQQPLFAVEEATAAIEQLTAPEQRP